MSTRELILESSNDVLDGRAQVPHSLPSGHVLVGRQVFKKYLELSCRFDAYLSGLFPADTLNLEPQKFVLIAENVTGQTLPSNRLEAFGRVKNEVGVEFGREPGDDSQPPVPVQSSEVMHVFEGTGETTIRVAQRFFSRVRLYRFKPNFEIVREWEFQESTVLEYPNLSIEDGKLQTICIGGRLGSLREGDCIPNQPIKARSQLISKLAEYEWQGRFPNRVSHGVVSSETSDIPPAVFVISNDGAKAILSNPVPFRLECGEVVCRSLKPAPTIFEPLGHPAIVPVYSAK